MTRDEAVDILMGRLGKRTSTVTQQDIINEMVMVQENVLEGNASLYWFLLSSEQPLVTVADQEYVDLPTDFLQEWDIAGLYYLDDDGEHQEMVKNDWDVVKRKITGSGKPEYYSLAGEQFLFRKLPDAVYTMYWRYYQSQASVAGTYGSTGATVENGWLKWASDLFIAEVGIVIAQQYLQSKDMQARFEAQAVIARNRLEAKNTALQEMNIQRYMEG